MRKELETKKKAKGTSRQSRIKNNPTVKPSENLGPPASLSPDAAEEWNAIADLLKTENMISDLDKKMLMMYCTEAAKYWDYTNQLAAGDIFLELKDKKGNVVNYMKNPLCDLANKALDNATKIGLQFGLTPLSRSKINLTEKPKGDSPEEKAQQAFNDILKKKGKQVTMKTA